MNLHFYIGEMFSMVLKVEYLRRRMDTKSAHVKWQTGPEVSPYRCGTKLAVSYKQEISSDLTEGFKITFMFFYSYFI